MEEKFREKIKLCVSCSLRSTCVSPVCGEGNQSAKVMLIGEAPGKVEDETGTPFCGRSGKILDEGLTKINLSRKQVYITNIVKCRPPGNRDPKSAEIKKCHKFLDFEIAKINPEIIVTLGRFAINYFFPKESLSKCHGKIIQKNSRKFLPLYHPAATMYNPKLKSVFFADFKQLEKIV